MTRGKLIFQVTELVIVIELPKEINFSNYLIDNSFFSKTMKTDFKSPIGWIGFFFGPQKPENQYL